MIFQIIYSDGIGFSIFRANGTGLEKEKGYYCKAEQ